jgi:DNA-binding response OmpR family regulator
MQPASKKSNARVLVIDDDPLFRNLMVSFLRREYIVSVASDGSEGFYKALEYPPDIAIVDVQMDVWDGLQTLKAFRAHPTLNQTKIIMLTSDASKETVVAAIQAGANDYIIKTSFSKIEFLEKVRKYACLKMPQGVNTPDSSKTQNADVAGNKQIQKDEEQHPEQSFVEATSSLAPTSVEDQLGELSLDQTEEEQLQEVMEDWE